MDLLEAVSLCKEQFRYKALKVNEEYPMFVNVESEHIWYFPNFYCCSQEYVLSKTKAYQNQTRIKLLAFKTESRVSLCRARPGKTESRPEPV